MYKDQINRIKAVLKGNIQGMTVSDVAEATEYHRNSVAKYLEVMRALGVVEMRSVGSAKLYFLSRRVPISSMLNYASDCIVVLDHELRVIHANDNLLNLTGVEKDHFLGIPLENTRHPVLADPNMKEKIYRALRGEEIIEELDVEAKGKHFFLRVKFVPLIFESGMRGITVVLEDITQQKIAEKALQISNEFLAIANKHSQMQPLLDDFLKELQNVVDCAAIGIRILAQDGVIPYEAYKGFSQEFYDSESPLSIKSDQCMCINVIRGDTDPALSFYTQFGSFFMNGTTKFLATVSEEEKGATRNVCNEAGYESVALIPIRLRDRILGLIHIADYEENKVPLTTVRILEGAALQLGTALQRVWVEDAHQESEQLYKTLFENVGAAIFIVDFKGRFLDVNQTACEYLGYNRDELLQMDPKEIDPSNRNPFTSLDSKELLDNENYVIQTAFIHRSGSKMPVAVKSRLIEYVGKKAAISMAQPASKGKSK
jgi:PAS domain S-box-containing protein